jgi:riboflavin kinase/FMN adenylyltransferase
MSNVASQTLSLPPARTGPAIVTLGTFDGVHLGHRALLDTARAAADARGMPVVAVTFDPSPRDVMQPGHNVPAIQRLEDRVRDLHAAGADEVVVLAFSQALASLPAEAFAVEVLGERLGAAGVVTGWDFRFGRGRVGDSALIARVLGVPTWSVPARTLAGQTVSSTAIRRCVAEGDLVGAAAMLGHPHRVSGVVVRGDQRGRTIGFPTANLRLETELRPPDGVYAVRVVGHAGGVANLGGRPTVGDGVAPLEVHLFDFAGDLYGHTLEVAFIAALRPTRRFPDLQSLRDQIARDAAAARAVLT